jgi:hypothetical protein
VVIALAMACLGAAKEGARGDPGIIRYWRDRARRMQSEELARTSQAQPAPPALAREELQGDEIDDPNEDRSLIEIYEEGLGFEPSSSGGRPDWYSILTPRAFCVPRRN